MLDFSKKKVVVIGDVMIDRYLGGGISGNSPEAEVPIFSKISESNHLGGAANVAVNITELGASAILLGIIGDDKHGLTLKKIAAKCNNMEEHLVMDPSRITTVKTRIISEGTHLLRVDSEDTFDTSAEVLTTIKLSFDKVIANSNPDAVILQDYNKGMLTPTLIDYIINKCNKENIPVFVDPKLKNFYEYKGATFFKPNKKELEEGVGKTLSVAQIMEGDHLEKLRELLNCEIIMVTLSGDGLIYLDHNEKRHVKAFPRTVADVCGAGDTVIAIITLGYISGYSSQSIALLANIAGGQVCEQSGVVSINLKSLKKEYTHRTLQ